MSDTRLLIILVIVLVVAEAAFAAMLPGMKCLVKVSAGGPVACAAVR